MNCPKPNAIGDERTIPLPDSERGASLLETALFLAAFLVAIIAVVAFLEESARERVKEGSSLYAEYDLDKR